MPTGFLLLLELSAQIWLWLVEACRGLTPANLSSLIYLSPLYTILTFFWLLKGTVSFPVPQLLHMLLVNFYMESWAPAHLHSTSSLSLGSQLKWHLLEEASLTLSDELYSILCFSHSIYDNGNYFCNYLVNAHLPLLHPNL